MGEVAILTVTSISRLIKERLESAPELYNVYLTGEVTGFKLYPSGHCYFSLRDSESLLSCVMWASYARGLRVLPQDGDQVVVRGRVTVYPSRGQYQFSVESLELAGVGEELLRLQRLKEQLAKEGLFDASRKRKLPAFPDKIAIIAGRGSAGMADILHNIGKRWPLAKLLPFPATVQGKEAPASIIGAIKEALDAKPEVMIIGRGGGAKEDLAAFNDEGLVRFAATLPIPFVSSVGHEIDTTLLDFVADVRVSTPTAAAVAVVPDKEEIYAYLDDCGERLNNRLKALLSHKREILEQLSIRPFFASPKAIYEDKQEKVGELAERLRRATANKLERKRQHLDMLSSSMRALSPDAVLDRGYSISYGPDGKPLTHVDQVEVGTLLKTHLAHGIIHSEVRAKEDKSNG